MILQVNDAIIHSFCNYKSFEYFQMTFFRGTDTEHWTRLHLFIKWVFESEFHDGKWKGCGILFNGLVWQSENVSFTFLYVKLHSRGTILEGIIINLTYIYPSLSLTVHQFGSELSTIKYSSSLCRGRSVSSTGLKFLKATTILSSGSEHRR